jgi:YHS domain-containing protein
MKRKQIILLIFIFIGSFAFSQDTCNVNSDGIAIKGYDVVSYFDNKAKKGKPKYSHTYKDIKYNFSTKENLEKFKKNSKKYLPQYGGWCAYAMGTKGEKVDMDPKVFEIRDGKLYLFYTSFFINTHKKWINEKPEELKEKADQKWKLIKKDKN